MVGTSPPVHATNLSRQDPALGAYQGKLIDAKGTIARYVRLYSNGSNVDALSHYIEVEVFSRPPE